MLTHMHASIASIRMVRRCRETSLDLIPCDLDDALGRLVIAVPQALVFPTTSSAVQTDIPPSPSVSSTLSTRLNCEAQRIEIDDLREKLEVDAELQEGLATHVALSLDISTSKPGR